MATITAHQTAADTIRLVDGRHPIADLTPAQGRRLHTQLGALMDQDHEPAPRLRLLGPVDVARALGPPPQAPARALELVTFAALHPWPTSEPLDEALWPGQRVTANKRNGPVNQARRWLGTAPAGHPYLCHIDQGGYALAGEVTTDWWDFLELARHAEPDSLRQALELVAAQPLSGVNPARYAWAEADRQEMITAVAHAGGCLAEHALGSGDLRTAAWASAKGTMADPGNEDLWRTAREAARRAGDSRRVADLQLQRQTLLEPRGTTRQG